LAKILSAFGAYYNGNNYLFANTDELIQNYRIQYANFVARYPHRPSRVRFAQQ